jgi:uncharacterized protein YqeY
MINIDKLIIEATKAQDIPRRDTYRLIKNEIIRFRTAEDAGVYDEDAEQQLLKDMVSAREKSIRMYKEAKREDLILKEEAEIRYISEFLPKGITEEDVEAALRKWMSDNGCHDGIPRTRMGEVMKWFKANMPEAKGKMTSDTVKKHLV